MPYLILFFLQLVTIFFLSKKVSGFIYRLLFSLTKSKKVAGYLFAILFAPGTFIHELSHFIVAAVLLVPVGNISVIPKIYDDEIRLGSVPIAKTDPLRRFLIGIAPFIVGIFILLYSLLLAINFNLLSDWRIILVIICLNFEIANTMFASKKDLEGAWIIFLIVFCSVIGVELIKINSGFDARILLPERIIDLLIEANIYILIPLFIDLSIVISFNVFRRFTN